MEIEIPHPEYPGQWPEYPGVTEGRTEGERGRELCFCVSGGRGVSIGVWSIVERKRRPGKATDSVVFLWHKGPRSSLTESLVL